MKAKEGKEAFSPAETKVKQRKEGKRWRRKLYFSFFLFSRRNTRFPRMDGRRKERRKEVGESQADCFLIFTGSCASMSLAYGATDG